MNSPVANPIVMKIDDNIDALNTLEKELRISSDTKKKRVIADYPTVYIHNWEKSDSYEVYVGETNDIFQRTREHYNNGRTSENWQYNICLHDAILYIIGHEHFNKSLTLDIENRLMHYLMSVDSIKQVHNMRGNPQASYYPMNELDIIFEKIWNRLHIENGRLFPTEETIKKSAIYKASPLHKLTATQLKAKDDIIEKIENALENRKSGQLIFIEGEAGTGKTVLNSSTFYDLITRAEEGFSEIKCQLMVNHDEQITVYEQIASKLGLTEKYGQVVSKPTTFINNHTTDNPIDVAFVDEAHLLLTQGKQSYRGKNQLEDIIERARITVVMFDENQILTTEQYWEAEQLERLRNKAKSQNNYIILQEQLRIQADPLTIDWIDSFTKDGILKHIPNGSDYTIKAFDNPEEMYSEIKKKAENKDYSLSRMLATYDWEYSSNHRPESRLSKYWEVLVGDWKKPWNYELAKELTKKDKKEIKSLAWAEQPHTIGEIGSTYTIQGFDLNFAGVILGPSVKYRDGRIVYDPSKSCNSKAVRNRTLSDGTKVKFGEEMIRHEVRVLMTRGTNGLYIYACDSELRRALLNS